MVFLSRNDENQTPTKFPDHPRMRLRAGAILWLTAPPTLAVPCARVATYVADGKVHLRKETRSHGRLPISTRV